VRILALPDMRERLQGLGADPVGNTPQAFAAFIKSEHAKWARVIKQAGVKVD
jgi:tripartite-type tricarboxylate transporter receptor subunit TctC